VSLRDDQPSLELGRPVARVSDYLHGGRAHAA
jgi:hypothetical protein